MVDRRPQDFPNGTPDGITDNTAAIQAAINAWQPGDRVIISGGTFRTSAKLVISQHGLLLKGDGEIRAKSGFAANSALVEVTEDRDRWQRRAEEHGSLFDLRKDTPDSIAKVLVEHVSAHRAETIARAILQEVKAKKSAHAG